MSKRTLLIVGVASMLVLGLALASIPFVASLSPSASRERPFIDVPLSGIQPGEYRVVEWLGQPVVIVRPTPAMLDALRNNTSNTWNHRAVTDSSAFVFNPVSPVHGCALQHAPQGPRYPGEENWPGGFFDPCHYGAWDYAGRTLKLQDGTPQLKDLPSPPFQIKDGMVRLQK
jgi:Rieske Fe-S protein